ncbi:MAG: AsmA family protein [Bacteroidetes bacterium]|nr:AsmA family protein [Bacteroidota bacterium]
MKKYLRITYYSAVIILFLLVVFTGFTQTAAFREYLRTTIIDKSHSIVNGQLWINSIEGNLLTGFRLKEVVFFERENVVISAHTVTIKYDPFALLLKRVGIANALVENPSVVLVRSTDGTWNIERLFQTSKPDTTPSPWSIDIKNVTIDNACVEVIDSLALSQRVKPLPSQCIDYAHIRIDSLTVSASLFLARNRYEATVRSFQCMTVLPEVRILRLTGVFTLRENEISAKNVHVVLPRSNIQFTASLLNTNIFRPITLENLFDKPVFLKLDATPLSTVELKQFLYPYVDFLDGELDLSVESKGRFGDCIINECTITVGQSKLSLQGRLVNLHNPENLYLSVHSQELQLAPSLTNELLPGLSLPNLGFLGYVTGKLAYEGTPQKFQSYLNARTSLGSVDATATISFETTPFTYDGVVRFQQVNIGPLLNDTTIQSSLNGTLTINGAGTNLSSMSAVMKAVLDSSKVYTIPINSMVLVSNIADGLLNSHLVMNVGTGRYELSSKVLFAHDETSYSVQGKVISCNCAEILNNSKYESSLSFQVQARGRWDAQGGKDSLELLFYPSSMGERSFDGGSILVRHYLEGNERTIILESEPFDLSCKGSYTLGSLIQGVERIVALYSTYFTDYLMYFENTPTQGTKQIVFPIAMPSQNVTFHLQCRDLTPFGVFIATPLEGDLELRGSFHVEEDTLVSNFNVGSREFIVDHPSSYLMLSGLNATITIDANVQSTNFHSFATSFHCEAQTLTYNHLLVDRVRLAVDACGDSGRICLYGIVDSLVTLRAENTWIRERTQLRCVFPVFECLFDTLWGVRALQPFRCYFTNQGIWVDNLTLLRDTTTLVVKGLFNPSGMSDIVFGVENFNLSDLKNIIRQTQSMGTFHQLTGAMSCRGIIRGTVEKPSFVCNLKIQDGSIHDVYFGTAILDVSYYENMLSTALLMFTSARSSLLQPDVTVRGTIPVQLSISPSRTDIPANGMLDIEIRGDAINAILLSPFFPILQNVSGTIACNLKVQGSVSNPEYSGSIVFNNVRFLVRPLGVQYILDGRAVSEGNRIYLEDVSISNVPEDQRTDGRLDITGSCILSGLSVKRFSLKAEGKLLVMKEQRMPGQSMYGTLYVGTSPQGLSWQGTPERSLIRGELYLLDAQLIFPPEREAPPLRASTIAVTFENDTMTVKETKSFRQQAHNGQPSQLSKAEESFLNNIDYDIAVETRGNNSIRFVFNTQTSEELFAVLKGRLTYNKVGTISRFAGQVEVGERSYYNFFKKFDAAGTITFTGDLGNPELNVTARYEGIHILDTTLAPTRSQTSSFSSQTDRERIAVILNITGTRTEPKVSTRIERYENNEWVRYETGDDESNAISFILSGQFTDELTAQQRTSLIGTNLGFGLAAGMITGPLSEALRRNTGGYIQSVDVLYYGGEFQKSADVRLTGQVGDAIIRFGGKVINDPFGNANVSVELPLSMLSRNLILSLEHKVESFEYSEMQRRAYNSAKIFYRFTF